MYQISNRIWLFILLSLTSLPGLAQPAKIGPSLNKKLNENPGVNTWLRITITFKEQVPMLDLLRRYEKDDTPLSITRTIHLLCPYAERSVILFITSE